MVNIYIKKNLSGKYNQKSLDHAKKSAADVKILQKMSFKKQQKQLMILLVKKLLIKSQGFQKMQKQLQMRMTKKYLKKDMCLEKKVRSHRCFKIKILV